MTAKEKMTAPIASVGADVEQPFEELVACGGKKEEFAEQLYQG